MLALKPPKAVWGGGTVSTTMTAWGVEAKRAFQLTSKPVPLRSQAQWGWARCHPTFRGCFQNAAQQPEAGGDQTTEVREIDGELSSCKVRVSFKHKLVQKCVLSTTHVSSQPFSPPNREKSNLYFFCQLKCEAKHSSWNQPWWNHKEHWYLFEATPWLPRFALFKSWGSDNKWSVTARN